MTVFENVLVGAIQGGGLRAAAAHDRALEALTATGMLELGNRRADTLGLLDRKRLELARAVATGPKVLLLDEIAGGLTDAETEVLVGQVRDLRARGIAILWIEHVVRALLQVAEWLICLASGRIIAAGAPVGVLRDPAVLEAYLGATG
jgi:branched-chain amino acid transport system ATP-binding protein